VQLEARRSYWESIVALARHIDPDFPSAAPRLSFSPDPMVMSRVDHWQRQQGATDQTRMVALHLGSVDRADYKRWPVSRFIELAERIRSRVPTLLVILTGTPAERSLVSKFAGGFQGHCADATVLDSVHATALLLERCALLVSNDTGVMHLGAALGTPTVGLFGATNPAHFAPVGIRATYVYPTRVNCSPCFDAYRGVFPPACRNAEFQRCMLDIDPAHVMEAARRVVTGDWLS